MAKFNLDQARWQVAIAVSPRNKHPIERAKGLSQIAVEKLPLHSLTAF
jgi:hypothetical protein